MRQGSRPNPMRVRRRQVAAWALGAWLVLMLLGLSATIAHAHDPIERLHRGDYDGFLDDALRTGWVVAAISGTASAALAPGLAAAFSQTRVSGPQMQRLERAVREGLAKHRRLQEVYRNEQARLDVARQHLEIAQRSVDSYESAQTAVECAALAWVLYAVVGAAQVIIPKVGAYLAPASVGTGTAIMQGTQRVSRAEALVQRCQQAVGQCFTAVRQAGDQVARGLAQLQLTQAENNLSRALAERDAAQTALSSLVKAADKAPAKEALDVLLAAGSSALVTAYAAVDTVRTSSLSFLQEMRDSLHYGKREEVRHTLNELREQYRKRREGLEKLKERIERQRIHCDALAGELDQNLKSHVEILTEVRETVRKSRK